jgi:hypothetical protein
MNEGMGICPVCGWEDHFDTLVHHVTVNHTPAEWLGSLPTSLLTNHRDDEFAEDREELTA